MVDGVLASCYASSDHGLCHIIVTPMRWFPLIMEWIHAEENEFHGYVKIAQELGRWLVPDAAYYLLTAN